MNILVRKGLTALVLLGLLSLLRIATPLNDWNNRIAARIGEGAFGTTLNEFLLGYSDPPVGPYYTQSLTWCYFVPLLALIVYYYVVDKAKWSDTGTWMTVAAVSSLVCAIIAYAVVAKNDGIVPSLQDVGVVPRLTWALLNFLLAALLGTVFSLVLAPAAVSTRLTPFGR